MIFVAVGTQKFQFNRLLSALDELKKDQLLQEEIFAQIGHSDYLPQNYRYKDFLSKDEFDDYVKKCDLLITHSGVATIMAGLKYNKPVMVVPRLAKFGEHVDDHQVQIAESFSEQNFVMMCGENDDLAKKIHQVKNYIFKKYDSRRSLMIYTIREFINQKK